MFIKRSIAYVLDLMIILGFDYLYASIYGKPDGDMGYTTEGIGSFFVIIGIFYLYHILQEYFWQQSIGKRLLKLKVVKDFDNKLKLGDIVMRHLFDVIELFLIPPVAFLVALSNKNQRRIGDFLAKTRVVEYP
jgi:uncharacterized RDD family membrane protein YckC